MAPRKIFLSQFKNSIYFGFRGSPNAGESLNIENKIWSVFNRLDLRIASIILRPCSCLLNGRMAAVSGGPGFSVPPRRGGLGLTMMHREHLMVPARQLTSSAKTLRAMEFSISRRTHSPVIVLF
jgi:hypothetical protein